MNEIKAFVCEIVTSEGNKISKRVFATNADEAKQKLINEYPNCYVSPAITYKEYYDKYRKGKFRKIPQVSKGSDIYYWSVIFPSGYKNRTITIMDWHNVPEEYRILADGDIRFELEDGKHVPYCNCCNKRIHKSSGKLFGSIDVGYELVYYCDNCNEGKYRIYSAKE